MRNQNSGGAWLVGLILLALVVFAVVHGVSGLGHLLGLTPTGDEILNRDSEWVKAHYQGVVIGYILTVLVIAFAAGIYFLLHRSRANASAEERKPLWNGAAIAAGVLAGMVIVLPAGPRGERADSRTAVLAGEAASKASAPAGRDRKKTDKRREQADRERRERDRDRRGSTPLPASIPDDAKRTTVLSVTDGDTVELAGLGASRLIGIDTPEVFFGAECFGSQASAYASRRLPPGTTVYYAFDVERIDRYQRELIYLWLPGGSFFNAEIAAEGYGVPLTISPNVAYAGLFRQLAARARSQDRGLWAPSTCNGNPDRPVGGSAPPPSNENSPPASGGGGNCTPGYSPCLPPASDYDCEGGSGDGPKYTGTVQVTGSDPYELDGDGDGTGC